MKFCTNCGRQAPDEDRFCTACGRPFLAGVVLASSPHSKSSHAIRNDLLALGAALLVVVVLGAAFFVVLLPFVSGQVSGPHFLVHSAPAPTGIADYGLTRNLTSGSGGFSSYRIEARQVTGQATINNVDAASLSAQPSSNSHLVSLELNVCLRVNSTKGTQVFLLQNVAFLNLETGEAPPRSHLLNFNNGIYNFSAPLSGLTNSTISGTFGWVYRGAVGAYSSHSYNGIYFSFPLVFSFYTNESLGHGGVTVMMGYHISRGASEPGTFDEIYDIVFIKIANVTGTALVVDRGNLNPHFSYLDAELVFGGPPGGYSTHFASMNSTLAIVYTLADGAVARPHSLWEFGSDTSETADNLQTNLVNGRLVVTIGEVDLSRNYQVS